MNTTPTHLTKLWTLICALLLSAAPTMAVDYYVDANSGDDTNNGLSFATAFATISQAESVSAAGDHIRVNHGIYKETLVVDVNGTSSNPIVYEGIGDVTIDGENIRPNGIVLVSGGDHTTIKNFKITRTTSNGIPVQNRSFLTITNCELDTVGVITSTNGIDLNGVNDSVISFNILNTGYQGIYLRGNSNRTAIDRNTVVNQSSIGILYQPIFTTHQNKVINNLVLDGGDRGIQWDSASSATDIVAKNNSFNNPKNWRVSGSETAAFGDNLNVDPAFVTGTFFLTPTSPMVEAGLIDTTLGRFATIGARGIGNVNSQSANTWTGWVDQAGNAFGSSTLVVVDGSGNVRLNGSTIVAAILSPVIQPAETSAVKAIRIEATQALFLPSGQKQVIDYDGSTPEPELRYRTSNTAFSQLDATPAWKIIYPGERIEDVGDYFQTELTLRKTGI